MTEEKYYYNPNDGIPDIKFDGLNGLRVRVKSEGTKGTIYMAYAKPQTRSGIVGVNMDTGGARVFKYTDLEFDQPEIAQRALLAALG